MFGIKHGLLKLNHHIISKIRNSKTKFQNIRNYRPNLLDAKYHKHQSCKCPQVRKLIQQIDKFSHMKLQSFIILKSIRLNSQTVCPGLFMAQPSLCTACRTISSLHSSFEVLQLLIACSTHLQRFYSLRQTIVPKEQKFLMIIPLRPMVWSKSISNDWSSKSTTTS